MDDVNESNGINQDAVEIASIKQRAMTALATNVAEMNTDDPQQKFDAAMAALKYGNSPGLANIALESALSTQDKQIQFDMLIQILNEISYLEDAAK